MSVHNRESSNIPSYQPADVGKPENKVIKSLKEEIKEAKSTRKTLIKNTLTSLAKGESINRVHFSDALSGLNAKIKAAEAEKAEKMLALNSKFSILDKLSDKFHKINDKLQSYIPSMTKNDKIVNEYYDKRGKYLSELEAAKSSGVSKEAPVASSKTPQDIVDSYERQKEGLVRLFKATGKNDNQLMKIQSEFVALITKADDDLQSILDKGTLSAAEKNDIREKQKAIRADVEKMPQISDFDKLKEPQVTETLSKPDENKLKRESIGKELQLTIGSHQIQQASKGTTTPVVVPKVLQQTGHLFPENLQQVKFVAQLGGSTGAVKVIDGTNEPYAKKTAAKNPDHLIAEYHTNKAYKALMGDDVVPEVALYHATTSQQIKVGQEKLDANPAAMKKPVMLSKFVPDTAIDLEDHFKAMGLQTQNNATNGVRIPPQWKNNHKAEIRPVQDAAKKCFVADCLLANWDVAGLTFDNIKYDPKTQKMWRIDNGAGLNFRAQGDLKDPKYFTPHIQEFETLRNPNINSNTSFLFETVTNQDIINQIEDLKPKKAAFLATIPSELKGIMEQRFDYMIRYGESLKGK